MCDVHDQGSANTSADTDSGGDRLIEVTDRRKRPVFRFGLVFGSAGAFILWLILLGVIGAVAGIAGLACFGTFTALCLIGGVVLVAEHRAVCRIEAEALAARAGSSDIHQAVTESLAKVHVRFSRRFLTSLVDQLAARGRLGTTIRACHTDEIAPVEPVVVPFEPRCLDDAREALFPCDSSDMADRQGRRKAADGVKLTRLQGRALEKWLVYGGLVFALGFIVLELYLSFMMEYATRRLLLVASGMVLGAAVSWLRRTYRQGQFFVVPAGLLVRRSRWHSDTWEIHLFARRRSVLVVYQESGHEWTLLVTDKEQNATFRGSQVQIDHALRAWLSPLSPPSVEQLSDLR